MTPRLVVDDRLHGRNDRDGAMEDACGVVMSATA
jgi:hypothetical protein